MQKFVYKRTFVIEIFGYCAYSNFILHCLLCKTKLVQYFFYLGYCYKYGHCKVNIAMEKSTTNLSLHITSL